jgi:hypothetical protein
MARLESSLGGQLPHLTKPDVFQGRNAFLPSFSPRHNERTCPHCECDQPRKGAEGRLNYRALISRRVGRNFRLQEARGSTDAGSLLTIEGSVSWSQTKPNRQERPSIRSAHC